MRARLIERPANWRAFFISNSKHKKRGQLPPGLVFGLEIDCLEFLNQFAGSIQ